MLRRSKCFILGCHNIYKSSENNGQAGGKTLFKAPKSKNVLKKWRNAIPEIGRDLSLECFVCEDHFSPRLLDIFEGRESYIGKSALIKRLKRGAVPTLFPNLPSSKSKPLKEIKLPCDSKKPTLSLNCIKSASRNIAVPKKTMNNNNSNMMLQITVTSPIQGILMPPVKVNKSSSKAEVNKKESVADTTKESLFAGTSDVSKSVVNDCKEMNDNFQILVAGFDDDDEQFRFEKLKSELSDIPLPSPLWSYTCLQNAIAFINWTCYDIQKKIIVTENLNYKIFIRDKEIKVDGCEGPKSFEDITRLLRIVESMIPCEGLELEKRWSINCTGLAPKTDNSSKRKCAPCLEEMLKKPVAAKKEAWKNKQMQKLSSQLYAEKLKTKGLSQMVQRLRKKNTFLNMKLNNSRVTDDILKAIERNDNINYNEIVNKVNMEFDVIDHLVFY